MNLWNLGKCYKNKEKENNFYYKIKIKFNNNNKMYLKMINFLHQIKKIKIKIMKILVNHQLTKIFKD